MTPEWKRERQERKERREAAERLAKRRRAAAKEKNVYRAVVDGDNDDVVYVRAFSWRQARSEVAYMFDVDISRVTRASASHINMVNEVHPAIAAQFLIDEVYNDEIEEGELIEE